MSSTALDPAAAIAAAGEELRDKLRQLVDTSDDVPVPTLLDELTALLKSVRGKVNRAKSAAKSAAPIAAPKPEQGKPATSPTTAPAAPAPAVKPASDEQPPAAPKPTGKPAPSPSAPPLTAPPSAPRRSPLRWLLLGVLVILGSAVTAVLVDQPTLGVAGALAGAAIWIAAVGGSTDAGTRRLALGALAGALAVALVALAVSAGRTDNPPEAPIPPPEVTTLDEVTP